MAAEESVALGTLGPAYCSLDRGETDSARLQAQQTLAIARAGCDRLLEAEALLCLSICDRFASRFRRCFEASQRASHLFQSLSLWEREAAALTTLSYAAGTLGRYEEAVEASLLALRLIGDDGEKAARMTALNYLGVNFFWGQSFDEADAALESAIKVARSCEPMLPAFQPMLNLGFSQYFRASIEREHTGRLPRLDALQSSIGACFDGYQSGGTLAVTRGLQFVGHAMWSSLASICHSWSDDITAAEESLAESQKWISACGSAAWLRTLAQLAEAELFWGKAEKNRSEKAALKALQLAGQAEHAPLARMTHCLLGHIYESQGQHDLALQAARKLRQREQQIRSEALASRARVVDWQLAIRRSERDVERLQILSRNFERVSLEDPLTLLANRRRIEQRLGELLRSSDPAAIDGPCVALIDVDSFKSINDAFSHQAGDRVLVALAQIFATQSRTDDLVGRLAGDEFVIIFAPCGLEDAQLACARIQDAVASHPWNETAMGLRVSVSIGIAKAQVGESMESVLHRSDLAMYGAKAAACHDLTVGAADETQGRT